MKLITRETDYAIRAITYMAKHKGKRISVVELVKNLKVPRPFSRKILQLLDKKGLLKSYKGKGGGFILNAEPKKIFLLDLIRIFQGRFSLNECFLKKHACPHKKDCRLRKKIDKIQAYVIKELKTINIEYLLS
jgi:Rrf2 family protein